MIRKHKKRYLGFRIPSRPELTKRQLLHLFLRALQLTPHPRIRILEYHAATGTGILVCSHTLLPDLRRAFHEITERPEKYPSMQLLGVSGTIKSLRRKFLAAKL